MPQRPHDISRRRLIECAAGVGIGAVLWPFLPASADAPPVEAQPFFASVLRAMDALSKLGAPIAAVDIKALQDLAAGPAPGAVTMAESILSNYTLALLNIEANGNAHVAVGKAPPILVEQGWRMFLVRVENHTGKELNINFSHGWHAATPAQMMINADGMAQRAYLLDTLNKAPLLEKMWLLPQMYEEKGLLRYGYEIPVVALSGQPIEYKIIQLFSRDKGKRSSRLWLSIVPGDDATYPGTSRASFDFDCLATRDILLSIKDSDGRGCVASLKVKDDRGFIYPPQAMRLAPDFAFEEHIYRADTETLRLPDGEYTIESWRGPEYLRGRQKISIGERELNRIQVDLRRWIDPAQWGWYSGDTHIHAAGCQHYQIPTEGVSPETMIRHVRGEGLFLGEILSWGPSWYYQKQFFSGQTQSPAASLEHPELQAANNANWQTHATAEDADSLIRYDVEVSGFPSSLCGHLVLLRLASQDYPGTKMIEDWPSWNSPILRWARAQGAITGYGHCGSGMSVDSSELPNFEIPPFEGVGTNEALVDVTLGLVDFISGCDNPPVSELNAWYHLLNCGYRLAMVGETDFPCISDERPGLGRSYVRLDHKPSANDGYDAWIEGLRAGRMYFGDGRSHFLEFKVHGQRSGDPDVTLGYAGTVRIEALVAARLETVPTPETEAIRTAPGRTWHIEIARVDQTRLVPVELVVNGSAIATTHITADGSVQPVHFDLALTKSSWVALRIMPSGHTYPVFVAVGGRPVRVSKRSAKWCRDCIDKLWEVKSPLMRESERPMAAKDFDHARNTYDAIYAQCADP